MNLHIDTHILIWYIAGHSNLNKPMINLLEDAGNNISISVASLWEIAIKVGKGKLDLGIEFHELEAILNQLNIQFLPILFSDLNVHRTLPFHHTDPFDRLVNVFKAGGQAKTAIDASPSLILVQGVNSKEAKAALRVVTQHQTHLLEKWEEYHG